MSWCRVNIVVAEIETCQIINSLTESLRRAHEHSRLLLLLLLLFIDAFEIETVVLTLLLLKLKFSNLPWEKACKCAKNGPGTIWRSNWIISHRWHLCQESSLLQRSSTVTPIQWRRNKIIVHHHTHPRNLCHRHHCFRGDRQSLQWRRNGIITHHQWWSYSSSKSLSSSSLLQRRTPQSLQWRRNGIIVPLLRLTT